jgi:tetratricopeptide (TPR) repeat protein
MSNQIYQEISSLIRQGNNEAAISKLRTLLEDKPNDEIAMSMLGSSLLRAKKFDEAMQVFTHAVDANPGSFAAIGDLAFAQMQGGQNDLARASFASALALNNNFYQGHCFLSKLQFEAGEIEAALASFRRSEECDPYSAEFPKIQDAMSASRFADAEKVARTLLARQPGYPKAAYSLAHLATTVGAYEESADILRRSIDLYPCDVNLRAALVKSYEELGHYERALAEAELIAELDPEAFAPWLIIGRVHGHCGHYQESLDAFDEAKARIGADGEESGSVELLRGHVLKILGKHEEGIDAYRRSIELVDNNGAGWWGLADMKTFRFDAADLGDIEKIADKADARPEQRTQAAFALGKAREDAGDYAKSFSWYAKANALRPNIKFDPKTHKSGIDELIRTFTADFLSGGTTEAPEGPTPIFITGLPRSGSTLVEQILASHSQIEGTMELVDLPNVVRLITIAGGKSKRSYPASLAGFSAGELSSFGQAYIDSTAIHRTNKAFFIDKMPTNYDKIGLLHMILPNAVIIDARRHPMDCGFSCFKQHFAGGHHFSYKLENIATYYNQYLRLMDHWNKVLPGKVLTVQYEDMVANTEEIVQGLLEHCGVPFEAECLRFFENKRPVRTASSEQVRQPIYNKSVQYWKNFETELEPLSNALGAETLGRFTSS